jgi:hypothetical protein
VAEQEQLHHLRVGDRAHRIVATLLRRGVADDRSQRTIALTRCARSVFEEHPIEYRPREAFLDAITAAGVYLQRFRPLQPWLLIGNEVPSGRCRFDLVHERDGTGVVIDELKLGVSRSGETAVRDQISRYVDEGSKRWGARFRGVRLCAVHEPTRSRLYPPHRKRSLLITESDLAAELAIR